MEHVSSRTKDLMEEEFNVLFEKVDGNYTKLLDLVTHDCQDYFYYYEKEWYNKHYLIHSINSSY